MSLAHIWVLAPLQVPWAVPLEDPVVSFGSGAGVTVRLVEADAEPLHIEIRRSATGYMLVRRAGLLWVNGKRVRQQALAAADLISFGRCSLSFHPGPPAPAMASGGSVDRARATLQKLFDFTRRLVAGDAPEAISSQMLKDILALTGGDRGALVLFDGDDPRAAVSTTSFEGDFSPEERHISRTAIARLIEDRRPRLWTDTAADQELAHAPSVQQAKIRTLMCAPIQQAERLLGALYISSSLAAGRFDQEALALLSVYANQAGVLLAAASRTRELSTRLEQANQELDLLKQSEIVGSSAPLRELLAGARRVAPSPIAVLLLGETGTGKDLIAREIHRRGPAPDGPLVVVNCGAIAGNLLESELFGHVRGAFTGALEDRKGQIRSAQGGTLFLDEVGELPTAQQSKLLRVLETHEVTPVGGSASHRVDFRLIAATNQGLAAMIQQGSFRQDLYYRVAGMTLHLPPLREREDDAVELVQYFLKKHGRALERTGLTLSAAALTAIRRYAWPGNVRELEAAVRRAILLAPASAIQPADLDLEEPDDEELAVTPLAQARDAYLKHYVEEVVEKLGGNRLAAARALMVSPRTVFKYLEEV